MTMTGSTANGAAAPEQIQAKHQWTSELFQPVQPSAGHFRKRRTPVQMFADIFWGTWLAMLVVGDPILNYVYGEQYSDTHFLVTHISVGLRAGIIGWISYHFLVSHVHR